jgi:DNA-binding beta-propeller fold protein YncE
MRTHLVAGPAALALAFVAPALPAQAPAGLSGTLVVADKQAASASFIDLASGEIVATAATGAGPHELVVSSDGALAVVTDYGAGEAGNTLTVLDVAAGRAVRTIDLGTWTRPHGVVFLPGDSLVAVTSETRGAVVLVRVADGRVVGALGTQARGSHMVAATADGARLYTGDIGSATVTELDARRLEKVRSFPTAPSPEAINVTPDGTRVFVGSNDEGTVSVIETDTGRRREIAGGFAWPYRMFLTPGADRLVVPDLRGETLRVFDTSTMEELGRLDLPGAAPQGLILHPDGRHLFLSLSAEGRVAVIDLDALEVVGHVPAGAGPDGVGYSPLTVSR